MTSQPPQDEVEEVARAILTEDNDLRVCRGPVPCLPGPCSCTRNLYPLARVAIATIDRLRSAAPAEEGWRLIAMAPKDLTALLGYQATDGDHKGRRLVPYVGSGSHPLLKQAADEIERLRAELARRSPSPDAEAARREAIEAARRIVGRDARYEDEWLNGAAVTVARAFLALSPPVEGE